MEVSDGVKKWTRIVLVTATYLVIGSAVAFADDRLTLIGRVSDSAGKPVEHPTVMVYHAGVKKGYSTYCPSCYVDCGKRTITDNQGMFILGGTPVFRGTRVPIQTLFDYLEGGETLEDFLEGFPTVTRESALAALEEAKDLLLSRP